VSRRFGKYDLLEPIATGGMAEVFKATLSGESGFERILAIKCILPHLSEDEEFVSMFVDEAKIAVQLSHSNIAQIFDLGVVEGRYFIALEYVHGRDLRAICHREERRGGGVPIPVACHIVMKVAAALNHAHNALGRDGRPLAVIHRDVSPQNILISFDGGVKVIDFGLAKAAGRATQTQAGVLKGKLAYLSPEQTTGEGIDHRSDIYALGICFHELLTGQRLFHRETDIDTIMAVRAGRVPRPSQIASDVPPALDAIVQRVLARDRDRRYQSAMELHDALEEFIYESGRIPSRRDLTAYMRDLFPEDVLTEAELPELDPGEVLMEEESGLLGPDLLGPMDRTAETHPSEQSRTMVARPQGPSHDAVTTARARPDASTVEERLDAFSTPTVQAQPDGEGTVEVEVPATERPPPEEEQPPSDTIRAPAPDGGPTIPHEMSLEGLLGMDATRRVVAAEERAGGDDDDDDDDEKTIVV
jgi:serine/threonine protein kinase